jgi:hypothetical protein
MAALAFRETMPAQVETREGITGIHKRTGHVPVAVGMFPDAVHETENSLRR